MPIDPNDGLPDALAKVRTRPLFVMRLDVRPLQILGPAPGGIRRVGAVFGGSFTGERLAGDVLDGGSDWQTVRADGTTTLDVRLVLRTSDGAMIAMTYRGLRHGPPDLIERLERGEPVDPGGYYFRIAPQVETAAARYDWLNRILAVGLGHREAPGPVYSLFELL